MSESGTDEETLDPRVQIELESLNSCTTEINSLEAQLDEANNKFGSCLSEYTQRLDQLTRKLGKCVERARPYYEAKDAMTRAQQETHKAAQQYERSVGVYRAAKETVLMAEQRFLSESEWEFDEAWQEMLNHATTKVVESEQQRTQSEKEHQLKASFSSLAEKKCLDLEAKLERDIVKSRPYFEHKAALQRELAFLRDKVTSMQSTVVDAKRRYSDSLLRLEEISTSIHDRRKLRMSEPRMPAVGAEEDQLELGGGGEDLRRSGIERKISGEEGVEEGGDTVMTKYESIKVVDELQKESMFSLKAETPVSSGKELPNPVQGSYQLLNAHFGQLSIGNYSPPSYDTEFYM